MDDRGDEVNRWMAQASEGHLLQVKTFFFLICFVIRIDQQGGKQLQHMITLQVGQDCWKGRKKLNDKDKEIEILIQLWPKLPKS